MTERVIDLLELVEVDEQHRKTIVLPGSIDQTGFQTLDEIAAIGQPGQRVVVGQIIQLALGLPALADLQPELPVGTAKLLGPGINLYFQ